MKSNGCPKLEKCPIYIENVLLNDLTRKTYKNLYCLAGEEKYSTCKRLLVSEKLNKPIPISILPNTSLTIEKIIEKVNAVTV